MQIPDTVYHYSSCYPASSLTDSLNDILRTLSLDHAVVGEDIKVYPNPSSTYLILDLEPNITVLSVQLADGLGKVIRGYSAASKLDIQGVAKGVYYLSVRTNRGNVTKKVVIQ